MSAWALACTLVDACESRDPDSIPPTVDGIIRAMARAGVAKEAIDLWFNRLPPARVARAKRALEDARLLRGQGIQKVHGHASFLGARESQEDRCVSFDAGGPPSMRERHWHVDAVFDGHGGAAACDLLLAVLPDALAGALVRLGDARAALAEAFEKVRLEVASASDDRFQMCGSTATVVVLDRSDGTLTVAQIGDSPAYWVPSCSSDAMLLTDPAAHRPRLDRELVEARGGNVVFVGCWRMLHCGVNMSSSIGNTCDRGMGSQELVFSFPGIASGGGHVVVASDGLIVPDRTRDPFQDGASTWEEYVASLRQEADAHARIVGDVLKSGSCPDRSATEIASELAAFALAKGSTDNTTVCVRAFPGLQRTA